MRNKRKFHVRQLSNGDYVVSCQSLLDEGGIYSMRHSDPYYAIHCVKLYMIRDFDSHVGVKQSLRELACKYYLATRRPII